MGRKYGRKKESPHATLEVGDGPTNTLRDATMYRNARGTSKTSKPYRRRAFRFSRGTWRVNSASRLETPRIGPKHPSQVELEHREGPQMDSAP